MSIAVWIAVLAGGYLLIGLLVAVAFVVAGVERIDPAASGISWGFRLLILPGAAVLWPLVAGRWLRRQQEPPTESSPHRRAAR